MNKEQIQAKKNRRDALVIFLNDLKCDGTDEFKENDLRDKVIIVCDLVGLDMTESDHLVINDKEEILISAWKGMDTELAREVLKDMEKINYKIKEKKT